MPGKQLRSNLRRSVWAAAAFAGAALLASGAAAQDAPAPSSSVFVQQIGEANLARVTQIGASVVDGASSRASVSQAGANNEVTLDIAGARIGAHEGASVDQTGDDNVASVTVSGADNDFRIVQDGDRQTARADQTTEAGGAGNAASQEQHGADNDATLIQFSRALASGFGFNQASQYQDGLANTVSAWQYGGGNDATQVQIGDGNLMSLLQDGNLNAAIQRQNGSNNQMSLVQYNDGNFADITQNGSGLVQPEITQYGGASVTLVMSN